jgi:hypothetical protein
VLKVVFITFFASVAFIFLKAFQQRNVAFNHLAWIVPTSLGMAFTEVYVIFSIAERGYSLPLVLAVGLGSGVGALLAVIVHRKVFQ